DRSGNIGCAVDGKCRLCAVSVECEYSVARCEIDSRRAVVADYLDATAVCCGFFCRENAACLNCNRAVFGELGSVSVYLDFAAVCNNDVAGYSALNCKNCTVAYCEGFALHNLKGCACFYSLAFGNGH